MGDSRQDARRPSPPEPSSQPQLSSQQPQQQQQQQKQKPPSPFGRVLFTLPLPPPAGGELACSEPAPRVFVLALRAPPDNRLTSAVCAALLRALDLIEHHYAKLPLPPPPPPDSSSSSSSSSSNSSSSGSSSSSSGSGGGGGGGGGGSGVRGCVITTSAIAKFYSNGLDIAHTRATPGFWERSLWPLFRRFLT